MVAVRLAETQTRIGELVALAAQLQTVAAPARRRTRPSGACGDGCPCATAAPDAAGRPADVRPARLVTAADGRTTPAIACSLDGRTRSRTGSPTGRRWSPGR